MKTKRAKSSFIVIGSKEVVNKKGEKESRLQVLPRKIALKLGYKDESRLFI